jgi:hypothetical protein
MIDNKTGWYGVDLDGTLAHYDSWVSHEHIGPPIQAMVNRVKQWLAEGKDVRIFTARMAYHSLFHDCRSPIEKWCKEHVGQILEVTNVKDPSMLELWDNRAVQVVTNSGQRVGNEPVDRIK